MTIFGWDMSHFDNPGVGTAAAEGISFITHKAGGDAPDAEVSAWWSGVKGLRPRVLLGAYWVLYPGAPASRADAFLDRLDATCPGWRDGPFLLQVDCEKWGGNGGTVPPKADIRAFCDRLVAKMPKLRPVVYAPKWVYGDTLIGLGYPLWASSYVTGSGSFKSLYPGDGSSKWAAFSGQTPAILQYTSSAAIGGQGTSDANAFRGTLADLTALIAPGWATAPASEDDVTPDDVKAIATETAKQVWATMLDIDVTGKKPDLQSAGGILRFTSSEHHRAIDGIAALATELGQAAGVDEDAIVTGVLNGLGGSGRTPEQIAAVLAVALGGQAAAVGAALQAHVPA
jgi:hypothetical protein